MPAIAVPAFALTWWLACYLAGRDSGPSGRAPRLRAAGALVTYAVAVAAWTVAPGGAVAQVLLCVPAVMWAGAAVGMLPADLPERRQIDRGWVVLGTLFLVMVAALPAAGRLVALAPLFGGVVVLWCFRDAVRPRLLPAAMTAAALLYGLGLAVVLAGSAAPVPVVAAMGVDLLVLGDLAAVSDAVDAGERLGPDLRRAALGAAVVALVCAGPAALTMLAAPDSRLIAVLQFVVVAALMSLVGLDTVVRRWLDRVAYPDAERLRLDRAALLLLAEALPRRRERHHLLATSEQEFQRLTLRALDNFDNLGRLLRSPLIDLPTVDRRLTGDADPLARARELRAVLRESVARLKPDGLFGTTDRWRHYNALHYCCVRGMRPYDRHPRTDGLDPDAVRAMEWFRGHVPRRRLRQWQLEGGVLVAERLWGELLRTDPRWLTRAPVPAARPTRDT